MSDTTLTPQAKRSVWGAFAAFFVDNFDIFLPVIALGPAIHYFVPDSLPAMTAIVADAMIFAATLIGRPLGALIFGHFADTIGRKRVTIICVFGFGVTTLLIAALPGYQHWGGAVIGVFILLRLIDGIFLGGEYTAANPLAMEQCPKEKRGLYGALIQSAASFGTAFIAVVTLIILLLVPAGDLNSPYVQWGWRIPFLIGAVMAFALGIYYIYSVEESEVWEKAEETGETESPLKTLFKGENLKSFIQVFVLMSGFWLLLNASLAMMPGLLIRQMHVRGPDLTFALVVSYLVLGAFYILGGIVSQRIGRRRYLMITAVISAVGGSFFYYLLLNAAPGDLANIVWLATATTVLVVLPGALGCVYINERFHTGVRATGFGLGYSLAIVLPAFYVFYQQGLANFMPFKYTVIALVIIGAVLVFIGAAWGPETKDVDFDAPALPDNAAVADNASMGVVSQAGRQL